MLVLLGNALGARLRHFDIVSIGVLSYLIGSVCLYFSLAAGPFVVCCQTHLDRREATKAYFLLFR